MPPSNILVRLLRAVVAGRAVRRFAEANARYCDTPEQVDACSSAIGVELAERTELWLPRCCQVSDILEHRIIQQNRVSGNAFMQLGRDKARLRLRECGILGIGGLEGIDIVSLTVNKIIRTTGSFRLSFSCCSNVICESSGFIFSMFVLSHFFIKPCRTERCVVVRWRQDVSYASFFALPGGIKAACC